MQKEWEKAFTELDKSLASADVVGGYDIESVLPEYVDKQAPILDFGCGLGHYLARLRAHGYSQLYGTDPSGELLARAPLAARPYLTQFTDGRLPYDDNRFSLVYASGVLHHIPWDELRHNLREIVRVLKPGGVFVYIEPRRSVLRSLGHVVILSPLGRLFKPSRALAEALRGEWETYAPWLRRSDGEFATIVRDAGLEMVKTERKLVTVVGVARAGKKS